MDDEIEPEGLAHVVRTLAYPVMRTDAAAELSEVTLVVDEQELNLGAVISETGLDAYQEPAELEAAVEATMDEFAEE